MKAHTILADRYHKEITQLSIPSFSLRLKSKMVEVCNFSQFQLMIYLNTNH